MKKLIIILGSLLVLAIISVVAAMFFVGSAVTEGINRFGPAITGTKVTLDSATISPISGKGTLNGLFVGNPPGWKSDKAFSFAKVHVSATPSSLFEDHIVINEIVIDGPEFVYETKIVTSNIKELLANIEKNIGGTGEKPVEQPTTKEGKPLKFEVKSLRFEHAMVTVGFGTGAAVVSMPPLVLTDLGTKEGGLTPDQLVNKIMVAILGNITKAAADSVIKEGSVSGAAKKAGESIKNIFNGDQEKK
jgi:hypothetical protein